jgi:Family of unknown function (DUF6496)
MAKYSKGAQKGVKSAMKRMEKGKLKSGNSDKKVTDPKQAIAIGLSEAKKKGAKVPAQTTGGRKATAKKAAPKKAAPKKAAPKKAAPKKAAPKKAAPKKAAPKKVAPKKAAPKKAAPKKVAPKKAAPKKAAPKKSTTNAPVEKTNRFADTKSVAASSSSARSNSPVRRSSTASKEKDKKPNDRKPSGSKEINPGKLEEVVNSETSITNESNLPPVEEQSSNIDQKVEDPIILNSDDSDIIDVETDDSGENPKAEM